MAETNQGKSNRELLEELGVELKQEKKAARTPKEERIIAGFEEIQRFVEENGHAPEHGEEKDIFERLYATRLDQIRKQHECRTLIEEIDNEGLLTSATQVAEPPAEYNSDEELLAELGIEAPKEGDITYLKHVKSQADKKAAEEIANRTPCEDFEKFKPLFDKVQSDLKHGLVEAKLLKDQKDRDYMAKIQQGDWFIVSGQKAYVAEFSEERNHGFDKNDYRLRVIYDNRTESDLLLRSLQKALYEDDAGRRIVSLSAGPLFDDVADEEDLASGIIYVLRSKSEHPVVSQNRDVIHKIGVTGGKVEKRIANAKIDPTFLMADVEVVATYELFNVNRVKLENLLHRFFENAKLDIEIADRFGNPVSPKEWFLVPLFIIDEVVEKIKDGTIGKYSYDMESAKLVLE
ncbi:MAG: GIY-YIG nuclease family protein [Candidatus Thiodiazotropha sp. (ex Lucina aurantia)]|nr:GIY-YIG nuclease family protein [Candidatus Thiodiazotropha taylori]MBV2097831.1 GIY-YIG nuclease family protein [Candidatus Thiodiazotropha sp. (ex Codakia orbicularis)]MBV2103296.1 GIY-YIG nuclease family protein [Candidatus Thiodiazotropha sp. (ex Lucina aurantia)]MBV2116341.1 GIY-YIG nuclease family protein [Candidatus Thiodiazotropha sp. (ex Lucina aurantia)]